MTATTEPRQKPVSMMRHLDVLAPLICEYYKFAVGKGGRTRKQVMAAKNLTPPQRETLRERLDDIDRCIEKLGKLCR